MSKEISEYQQGIIKAFADDPRFSEMDQLITFAERMEAANNKARGLREANKHKNGNGVIHHIPRPFMHGSLSPLNQPYHQPYSAPVHEGDYKAFEDAGEENCIIGVGVPKNNIPKKQ